MEYGYDPLIKTYIMTIKSMVNLYMAILVRPIYFDR